MKTQLIATGIRSLHEARYFAAMGVGWIGFDLSATSIDEINAISEWVVGPLTFAEVNTVVEGQIYDLAQKTGINGISFPSSDAVPDDFEGTVIVRTDIGHLEDGFPESSVVMIRIYHFAITESTIDLLKEFCGSNVCWFELDYSDESVLTQLKEMPVQGIAIRAQEPAEDADLVFDQYDVFIEAFSDVFTDP
jgi:hypothetical protein